MQKKVWVVLIVWVLGLPVYAQSNKSLWVDSVFNTLSVPDKIGQLLMLSVDGTATWSDLEKIDNTIRKNKIGGLIFSGGGPVRQANILNFLQAKSEVPLLIGMNAEQGPGAVLDSIVKFPPPLMLGSIRDDSLIHFLGEEIGRQFRLLGVHLNFSPTADLSTFFQQEELALMSYGDNKERVAAKLVAYQSGLRKSNVLAIAKHYPDNELRVEGFQKGVPILKTTTSPERLYPLQILIDNHCAGVVSTYENEVIAPDKKRRFADKKRILSDALPILYSGEYLKRQVNLKGLVFSFVPEIQDHNKKFGAGDAEVFAFQAGNDVLLFPKNINATVRKMRRAIRKNSLLEKQLDESVKKILAAKFDVGLNKKTILQSENLIEHLNTKAANVLQAALFERSVTVVKDEQQFLPIKQLDNVSFASLAIGETKENTLTAYLSKYVSPTNFKLQTMEDTVGLVQKLSSHTWVIVSVYPNIHGLENFYPSILQRIGAQTKVIVVVMDSPSNLARIDNMPAIIQAYTDHEFIQQFIPQLIFGAKKANGVMPVSVNEKIKQGAGIQTLLFHRMAYSTAEAEGLDSRTLDKIARVAREAIEQQAAPGSQVLVARHGKIIYEKSFGTQTYENGIPVTDHTIYDLASVTKVMGTLQAVMFLYDKGMIDIYKKASVYLPELASTNKKDIVIKDILTHQSGLTPFLLMWPQTAKGDTLLPYYYSSTRSEAYPLQVAPDLFASPVMKDSIWQWILNSPMLNKPVRTPYNPRYSDLGFMILHRMIERMVNQPMEDFLSQNVYEPLGAGTVGYLPLERFPPQQIAPTEVDTIFRKATVVGTVHDERAAMLGGVAGHAGLFGSGIDLLKLGQMLLQKGNYGGQQFYKAETIELFAQKQFENSTRGLGWAKPGDPNSPSSRFGSPRAFGHTGFTGTCIWMDPDFDLVFIFLSNSRFPYRSGKLNTTNIRSRIQDLIYQSIFEYCQYGDNEPDHKLMAYIRKTSN